MKKVMSNLHPVVVFWLGILTGVIIMVIIFLSRVMNLVEYESALLKYNMPKIHNMYQMDKGALNKKNLETTTPSKMEKLTPAVFGEINPVPGGKIN